MKRVAIAVAIMLATLLVVLLLWQFRAVVGLFVLSLAVAATFRPAILRLIALKVPTGLSILLVYLIAITLTAVFVVIISQPLISDIQHLVNDFSFAYDRVKATWPRGSMVEQMIANQLPSTGEVLSQLTAGQGAALAQTALGVTMSLFDLLSQILLILVLSIYWSTDQVRFERLWLSLLKAEERVRARTIWRSVETGVGAYIRSEVLQSVLAVVILGMGYTILGVHYPILVALIAAVLWFIPLVGGLLVFAVALVVGLLSGPLVAVGAVVLTVALLAVLELYIEPRLFDRKGYNPILVLLVMIAMTDAFGLIGLIVAPPLAVAIQICLAELTTTVTPIIAGIPAALGQPAVAEAIPQVSQIRDRLATVRRMLAQMEEPSPRLVSMTDRLEGLVKELNPIADEEKAKG